jgi:hypothetical protein
VDSFELLDGKWRHHIYFPTPASNSSDAQLSLVLAVIMDGALITVPQPISAHVSGTSTISKSGDKWPGPLAACNPTVGCAEGLYCSDLTSDFRCVPIP